MLKRLPEQGGLFLWRLQNIDMKKIILTIAAIILAASVLEARGLNLTAGYNTVFEKATSGAGARSTDVFNGFHVGVGYTFREIFGDHGNIATGLQYVGLFGKSNEYSEILKVKGQEVDSYLQLPVRFSYLFDTEKCDYFLFAGPKFLFGMKSEFRTDDVKFNWYAREMEHSYSRFNLMLGIGAGMYIGEHFRMAIGYDWGVLNRYKGELKSNNYKLYQSMLTVNVAMCF